MPAGVVRRLHLVVWMAAVASPAVAFAAQGPQAWFARMQSALRTQSYEGTVVYIGHGQPMAYQLVVCNDGYARLTALSGPSREIVRGPRVAVRLRGNGSTMIVHGTAGATAPLPFPPATQTPTAALAHNYHFELGGESRVAGESARLVELVARDPWRYGYRVWIGQSSGLPLRSELVDRHGKVLEEAFFTRLVQVANKAARKRIGKVALGLVEHASKASVGGAVTHCPGEGAGQAITLRSLPPGFHKVRAACQMTPGASEPVTHLLISDGLATVSVFVVRRPDNGTTFVGGTALGPVHAVGRVDKGYAVTAMGTVPFRTVGGIARAVEIAGH